jgi:hypothetical protein
VDNFTHEPEVGLFALAEAADSFEKVEVDAVSGIKSDTVNTEFLNPVIYCINKVVAYANVAQIELNQIIVTVPALIPEVISAGALSAKVKILEPVAVA